jgi:hypothetical protein
MTTKPPSAEPTEQTYNLKCNIVVKEISYDDIQSKGSQGNVTRKIVCLVPYESSEMYRFFSAWLGLPGKLVEVVLKIEHPFHVYARGAVLHPMSLDPAQSHIEDHHIFLMSHGLTQIILGKPHLHGKDIVLSTCPESEDHADGSPADTASDGDDLVDFDRKEVASGLIAPPETQPTPANVLPTSRTQQHLTTGRRR